MREGMTIPKHTHPNWVQVMVLEGEIEVETELDGTICIAAGGCYFVEPGDSHKETAVVETLVLVTQGEDRPEFLELLSKVVYEKFIKRRSDLISSPQCHL